MATRARFQRINGATGKYLLPPTDRAGPRQLARQKLDRALRAEVAFGRSANQSWSQGGAGSQESRPGRLGRDRRLRRRATGSQASGGDDGSTSSAPGPAPRQAGVTIASYRYNAYRPNESKTPFWPATGSAPARPIPTRCRTIC